MLRTARVSCPLCFSIVTFGVSAAFGQTTFRALGDLPGGIYESHAYGISADGKVVVGASRSGTYLGNPSGSMEGFYWTAQTGMVNIGDIAPNPPVENDVYAASRDGSVLVGQGHIGYDVGYWWQGGSYSRIYNPDSSYGAESVLAVSADGRTMAGYIASGSLTQAMRWKADGSYLKLGDLPGGNTGSSANGISADGKVIVGKSKSANGWEAFRWTESQSMEPLGDLPGGGFASMALAASADGSVIVGQGSSALGTEAARWTAQTGMVGLGDLPGGAFNSVANAVSADGSVIVGKSQTGDGTTPKDFTAFIWDSAHGMRDLKEVLVSDLRLDLSGWKLMEARGISADGLTLVGTGINPDGEVEGWVAHIPEPTTLCLLLPALLFHRHPRNRHAAKR